MDDPFYDRDEQIRRILEERPGSLLNIYGEAGIGKTRLLQRAAELIKSSDENARIAWIDLDMGTYRGSSSQCSLQFLIDLANGFQMDRQLLTQLDSSIPLDAAYLEEMAGKIQLQMARLSGKNLWIFVDTTEVLQAETGFWRWMEEYLVEQLLSDGRYHLVFSGRVPAPWRHAYVRRNLSNLSLEALDPKTYSIELAKARIQRQNQRIPAQPLENLARLIVKFSSGHPELTCMLSDFIGEKWASLNDLDIERQMCAEVVKPFIDQSFLRDVEKDLGEDWIKILWAACILNWFDTNILKKFLEYALPTLAPLYADKPFFYIEAINKLRLQYSVIWRDKQGEDHLYGVIGTIMRNYLQTIAEPYYLALNEAASQTFLAISKEFPIGDPDSTRYQNEAEHFANPKNKERVS